MAKFSIEIKKIGNLTFKQAGDLTEFRVNELLQKLELAGKDSKNRMVDKVAGDKKRPKPQHLRNSTPIEDAINYIVNRSETSLFIGIGEIDKLNSEAPHWFVQNYGGMFPSGTQPFIPGGGKFVPGAFQGNNFIYAPYSQMGMIPKKPIEPKHYIEYTQTYFENEIKKIVKSFKLTR